MFSFLEKETKTCKKKFKYLQCYSVKAERDNVC